MSDKKDDTKITTACHAVTGFATDKEIIVQEHNHQFWGEELMSALAEGGCCCSRMHFLMARLEDPSGRPTVHFGGQKCLFHRRDGKNCGACVTELVNCPTGKMFYGTVTDMQGSKIAAGGHVWNCSVPKPDQIFEAHNKHLAEGKPVDETCPECFSTTCFGASKGALYIVATLYCVCPMHKRQAEQAKPTEPATKPAEQANQDTKPAEQVNQDTKPAEQVNPDTKPAEQTKPDKSQPGAAV
jgi:hypothetical protein